MILPKLTSLQVFIYCNGPELQIVQCVESVLANTPNTCDILFLADGISKKMVNKLIKLCKPITKKHKTGGSVGIIHNHIPIGLVESINKGLATVLKEYICIIDSSTQVTPGWLDKLYTCMLSEPSIGAVAPLTSGGNRQNICQNIAIDRYSNYAVADLIQKTSKKLYPRVTSVDSCMLINRDALQKVGRTVMGLNPMVDLCHRIRKAGFSIAIADNVFVRYTGPVSPYIKDDQEFFSKDPLRNIRQIFEENLGTLTPTLPINIPEVIPEVSKVLQTSQAVSQVVQVSETVQTVQTVKIYSPSDNAKDEIWWGDYWVKENLLEEFEKQKWHRAQVEQETDFSIHLMGMQKKFSDARIRAAWIYSHPDKIDIPFLTNFDLVYTLSHKHADTLKEKLPDIKVLLPATSKQYRVVDVPKLYDVLIVGNTAKPERIQVVKYLIAHKYKVGVVGPLWEKYIDPKYIIAPYWDNSLYPELYAQSALTVYTHADNMRRENFVAVRVLDIIASSDCFVICDDNKGLVELGLDIPRYIDYKNLDNLIKTYLKRRHVCNQKMQQWRQHIANNHTFEMRTKQILSDVTNVVNTPKFSSTWCQRDKRAVVFLSKIHNLCFDFNIKFAMGMVEAFKELGFDSELTHDYNRVNNIKSGVVFCAAPSFQERIIRQPGVKYIMYQSEQCPMKDVMCPRGERFWKVISEQLPFYDVIFEPCERQIDFLRDKGYQNVVQFRVGYHKSFELSRQSCDCPYDIIFIGHPTGEKCRRQFILETLSEFCEKSGVVYNFSKLVSGRYQYITGTEYADMLFAGKMFLNLHFSDIRYFEYHKLITDCFCNRRFVLSEPITHLSPFKNGEHLITCDVQEMPDKIAYYLKYDAERNQIANNVYEFVKREFTLVDNLRKALKESQLM